MLKINYYQLNRVMKMHLFKHIAPLFIIVPFLLSSCKKKDETTAPNANTTPPVYTSNTIWEKYLGYLTTVPYLPDAYSNYFVYSFARPNNGTAIKLTGKFANARYMSINVYDQKAGDVIGAISDLFIKPDAGSVNSYVPGFDASNQNRTFTVDIVPTGTDTAGLTNPIVFSSGIDSISIFIRYYLPTGDDLGGVELPTITMSEASTNAAVAIPSNESGGLIAWDSTRITNAYKLVPYLNDTIRAVRTAPSAAFPNGDTEYISIPVIIDSATQVAVIKFKPPTYPASSNENGKTEVRYFSLNQGDHNSYNYGGIYDKNFANPAKDGFVYVIMCSKDAAIEAKIASLGGTTMIWTVPDTRTLLLYRYILADSSFSGNMKNVKIFDSSNSLVALQSLRANDAVVAMGDYAPRGIMVSKDSLLRTVDITKLIPF